MARTPVLAEMLSHSTRFSGPGVFAAIEAVGAPRMRDASRCGWIVPLSHASDVIAHLEHVQRRHVQLVETAVRGPRP